jgi:hypothetical protein
MLEMRGRRIFGTVQKRTERAQEASQKRQVKEIRAKRTMVGTRRAQRRRSSKAASPR